MKAKKTKTKSRQGSMISARVRNMNIILLVLVLVVTTSIAAFIIKDVADKASDDLAFFYSREEVERFDSYMSRDLALVQKIAHSKAVKDWFADEKNEEKRVAAYNEMMDYTDLRERTELFFGIHKSLNEFSIEGDVALKKFQPYSTLDSGDPDDAWYFNLANSDKEYVYNIDAESRSRKWRIWINHKVISDGELVGVFCSGLDIDNAFQSMFSRYEDKNVKGYVINKEGVIQLGSGYTEYHTAGVERFVQDEVNNPDFDNFINSYLDEVSEYFDSSAEPRVGKLSKGVYGYISVAPIINSDWSVVTLFNNNSLYRVSNLLPLFFSLLAAFVLYALASSLLMRRSVLNPLRNLTNSVIKKNESDAATFGSTRDDEIGELARAIQAAWAQVNDEYQRTQLMLDATPLACRLMKRVEGGKFELFECNEESVKLFNFKNKKDFMERYFETYPECQTDGSNSIETAQRYFEKAYAEGHCVMDFDYQTIDGEPIPAEVTLVRVRYAGEDVVAGYTRDLREHKRMLGDIEKRDNLLNVINSVAEEFLTATDEDKFEETLVKGMEHIGRCLETGCVWLWENEIIDEKLHFVLRYKWIFESGVNAPPTEIGAAFPYTESMKELFLRGECINGPVSSLSEEDQKLLRPLGLKSTIAVPVFDHEVFWGLFCVDDYIEERCFTEDESNILNSAGLLLLNAINRNKQAAQVRDAFSRTQILFDITPLSINFWDKNAKIFDCNEESVRLFKAKDKQEYLARFDEMSPEFQEDGSKSSVMVSAYVKKAFDEGMCRFEWMHQTLDGTLLPSEITLIRVFYENDYALAAYIRDLREYKKMMSEIERNSNLLGNINEAANILLQSEIEEFEDNLKKCMGMIGEAVNADRICIWRNSVKEGRLCCTQVSEWVADDKLLTDRGIATEVPYDENIPTWEGVLSSGECVNSLVSNLPPVEQERMKIHGIKSVFAAPVFVNNEFWGFVGCDNCKDEVVFTDEVIATLRSGNLLITNALIRNEMTMSIQKAAVELEEALKETQKANNAKSDFLANMSHEMRTPLNAIIGLSGLSMENCVQGDRGCLNLEKIYNAGEMLLSIVNDILDISKIEAGKMELVEVDYDVPSLINDTVAQNMLRIGERPIELKLDIGKDLFSRLHGDELRVKQIMNNLLSNAIKYTEEGSVRLSLHCKQEGDIVWVDIKVTDTGIGIRSEDIKNLFIDYAQIDLKSNRKKEGTGLGLPIVKSLADMMGGWVNVESEYGKGSVFTVRLAQKHVSDVHIGQQVVESLQNFHYSDEKRMKNSKLKRISLPDARVLVVDDNATNLDVAKGLMNPYEMQIDCVSSGQEAVDAIRDEKAKYNAVFMDHMMPGMDGIEATRIIRDEIGTQYAKDVPIIALTANAIAGNEAMFLSKGFQAFIPKPVEISRLDEVIKRWVRDKGKESSAGNDDSFEIIGQSFVDRRSGVDRRISNTRIDGLDIDKGIKRFGGKRDEYFHILQSYVKNTTPLLEKIEGVKDSEMGNYAVTVHGIKGSSRNINADGLGLMAEKLEDAAKSGNFEFVSENNAHFIKAVRRMLSEIDEMLKRAYPKKTKPKEEKPDVNVLKKLLDACVGYDTDEIDIQVKFLDAYEYESDGDLVDELVKYANEFKFKKIKVRLKEFFESS